MNMKKHVVLVLAAVLASAVSAKVSQDRLRVFQEKGDYISACSGWHREMQRVQHCARSEDPFLKDQLPGAISRENMAWICYTNMAERVLSSADDRLSAKILERLEKDRSRRPRICIDAEKALKSDPSRQTRQQTEKRQTTNLFRPTLWKKVTFRTEPVSRLPGTKAEPRRLSGKMVEH